MKKIIMVLFSALIVGCSGGKHKMYDIANDDYFSVDDLIESGEYIPDYCEGRLDRLIKAEKPGIGNGFVGELNRLLAKWSTEKENYLRTKGDSTKYAHSNKEILNQTRYLYSYIFDQDPIHVFLTPVQVRNNKGTQCISLFIRADEEGHLFSDYSEENHVDNKCPQRTNCSDSLAIEM